MGTDKVNEQFRCIKCGLCCKNIQLVPQLHEYHNGDGICRFLDLKTNLCSIYNHRPDICNVEKSYELYFSNHYTEEEYLEMNYIGCETLWRKK